MRRLAAILALAIAAGCGFGSTGAECTLSEDCDAGLVCFASTCRASGIPQGTIAWRISPDPSSGLVPAAFDHRQGPLDFTLCPPSTIAGTLGFEGRARLVAEGELASLPRIEERHELLVDQAFEVGLPPGGWTLTFHPLSGLPPIRRKVQLARCETRMLSTIESGPTRTARLQLVIEEALDPRPRCGAFVRIHDPRSGAPLSARLELRAPAGASCEASRAPSLIPFRPPEGHGFIEIRIGALDGTIPTLPEQRIQRPLADGEPLDLGVLSANPGGGSLQRVLVHLFDHERAPQRRAHLVAEWLPPRPSPSDPAEPEPGPGEDEPALPAPELRFRSAPAVELEAGIYELWLLPGRYAFRAEPPASAPSAVGSCVALASDVASACGSEIELGPTEPDELAMVLPRKLLLRGSILGAGPVALEETVVTAVPARGSRGRSASTFADRSGVYRLDLDAGDYDLIVRPGDRLLPVLHRSLPLPLLSDATLDLVIPDPALVLGTVRRSEGLERAPLPDALLRAYLLQPGSPPLLLGEALTGFDGSFHLVLPGG